MPHHQGGESSEREEEMHKDQMLIALGNEIDLEQWRARELGCAKGLPLRHGLHQMDGGAAGAVRLSKYQSGTTGPLPCLARGIVGVGGAAGVVSALLWEAVS